MRLFPSGVGLIWIHCEVEGSPAAPRLAGTMHVTLDIHALPPESGKGGE